MLELISEITTSTVCIELEFEKFNEFGCYLYRVSIVIMELQTTENASPNVMQILQSLSKSINLAKDLVKNCEKGSHPILDTELKIMMTQLGEVIKSMGECLSSIPSSTFRDQEYAEVAVQCLSKEMMNTYFEVTHNQELETKEQKPTKEEPPESDLYSISQVTIDDAKLLGMPRLGDFLNCRSLTSHSSYQDVSRSMTLPKVAHYIEPLYETFFCPLTKEIMEDPVTIETGLTYEKEAILEWFEKFENSEEVVCPTTGQKLSSRHLSANLALKTTIEEWKGRNDAARIKVARAALSLASSDRMVFEAIKDLQNVCRRKQYNKVQVCNVGMLPLLVNFLGHKDGDVRCAVLDLLHQLVEEDDDGKV